MKIIFAMIVLCALTMCKEKKPVYVPYFLQGQIIPDKDTLVVIDAIGLNTAIGYYEQGFKDYSENQLDSIFYQYCKIK